MKNKLNISWFILITSIVVLSESLLFSQENHANGRLLVNEEVIELKYAYAIPKEGFFDNSEKDILVIITDVPLHHEDIEDSFNRRRKMTEGNVHGVEVIINANKEPISVTVLHNAFKAPPSGRGYEILKINKLTNEVIEGEIYTSRLNDFFGTAYEYNAEFKANIILQVRPTDVDNKTAEESKYAVIYREYEKCIKERDFNGLKNLVAPAIAGEMSREEASEMFDFMQMTMPKNVKFLRLSSEGQKVKLEMSGDIEDQMVYGKANFLFIGKEWKIGEISWGD